jgi:hypothetical protein
VPNRIVVHIGPIKSGTTALARYLTAAADRGVLPATIVYPSGDLWFHKNGAIVRQRDELLRAEIVEGRFVDDEMRHTLAAIAGRLREIGDAAAILIAETGNVRFTPATLTPALREFFDEVTYVLMARRQDAAIASIVAQRAKMWDGEVASLDPRTHVVAGDADIAGLDFDAMLDAWAPTDGEHSLTVVPYLEGDQGTFRAIARVFAALGLPDPPEVTGIEGRRIHPTFSRDGMQALVRLKRRAARWGWIPGLGSRFEQKFAETVRLYHATAIDGGVEPSGRKFAPWRLTPADREWVRARFEPSNRRFLARVDRRGFEDEWDRWSAESEAEG